MYMKVDNSVLESDSDELEESEILSDFPCLEVDKSLLPESPVK